MLISKFLLFILTTLISSAAAGHPLYNRRRTCPRLTSAVDVAVPETAVAPGKVFLAKPTSTGASSVVPTQTPRIITSRIPSSTKPVDPVSTGTISGLLGFLFPATTGQASWTTLPSSKNALPLSDGTFRPTSVLKSVPHTYVNSPDGKLAMKAHYPKGSFNFGHNPQGGFSFYAPGPQNVDLTQAKEATFGYSLYFRKDFEFQLGGKLPGFYGGNTAEGSLGCSGGRRDDGCFSARLMWRDGGKGEFYTYFPPSASANQKLCTVAPSSYCNPTYGASVGTGSFHFATGAWTTVSERVRLNDVGQANGQIELFVNGKSVINVSGLVLRTSALGRFRGLQMQTFFGGSHVEFATPKDQDVYFTDFSVAITQRI